MFNTILIIINFILCLVGLGITLFSLERQKRLNKELSEEKSELMWQNEKLRAQVEFFEMELSTEETEKEK